MKPAQLKVARLSRRIRRVRKTVIGTPDRPRLAVTRTNKHIIAQIIDDYSGRTLVSASSLAKDIRGRIGGNGNAQAAAALGKILGERALAAGLSTVQFDRRGRRYHGRIKALADAAREAGLKF